MPDPTLLVREGKVSLSGFGIGCTVLLYFILPFNLGLYFDFVVIITHLFFACFVVPKFVSLSDCGIISRAGFLGWGFSVGVVLNIVYGYSTFGAYVVILTIFHYTEYLATAFSNPSNLTTASFLLDHSKEYGIALLGSLLEYFLRTWYFGYSGINAVTYFGIVICVLGELLRKLAMIHAGKSFNHIVQTNKKEDHVLVVDGIYAYSRHPSYVGWFMWSLGTQFILRNPLCFVAYAVASWHFFNSRIYSEEYFLMSIFGAEYEEYSKRVPIRIPFIRGYKCF